ncbi:N-acetylmuramate alpha-1-phosphate uridylyltransferase MurU [Sulfurimonas sp. C5]|uniref:N-acetylmuramate alpha-1-phosphate uridylyltransferase MurU n=1 Tax=Sulfurimonas sp. C5 TaxID=3036947 RepID=UPI002457E56D|nr:nucleotidyltransferase family protein [Sulfurimonas sp. C5]MDH4944319.1 nucleotidyltransferase family protein [Sulfurimonas sp. C5]
MKAMILAAGRGERMRPLTDTTPKPLLKAAGKELIVWHLEKLAKNGFKEIVINIAHLGDQIPQVLGDGSRWGVNISYSDEQDTGALESAGGIKKALTLLDKEPFLVVNGDVFCEYDFDPDFDLQNKLAHLILVPNPSHNEKGDFGLENSLVLNQDNEMWTFSGIAYYNPEIFNDLKLEKSALAPLLRNLIEQQQVSGEIFKGLWRDIGTPERLQEINEILTTSS